MWHQLFASWVPTRQPEAEAVAAITMQCEAARIGVEYQQRAEREASDLQQWLRGRADDICGAFVPRTGDMFGATTAGPEWLCLSAPLDRLAGFAADGNNPPARRREANSAVELFQRRGKERDGRALLVPPVLRLVGMLMLVPQALIA
jgi:hypothetical protein